MSVADDPHRLISLADVRAIPDMTWTAEEVEAELAGRTFNGTEDDWQAVDLSKLGPRPPVQPTLGGVGLVYPGERHVFSGPPESAKTLAAYAIGLEVIRAGGTIVIIDFEMGRWQARDRLVELGATPGELGAIYYVDPVQPATEARIGPFVRSEPQLVIIDAASGAYDNLGLDDNKRGDVERFTRIYVNAFWRAGIATIVLDHVVKNADNRGKYVIGSERKLGGSQVHLGFDTIVPIKRGTTGIYKITTHKDRGGYLQRGRLADLHLTSDPETNHIKWEFKEAEHTEGPEPWRPTVLMGRVSEYLEQHPDDEFSKNQIIRNVKGNDKALGEAIDHLVALGHAVENPGEKGAKIITHVSRYTPPPPPPPTSASPPPAEVTTTSAHPPYYVGGVEAEVDRAETEVTSAKPIDVYDPAIQAMLDGPSMDHDIPF